MGSSRRLIGGVDHHEFDTMVLDHGGHSRVARESAARVRAPDAPPVLDSHSAPMRLTVSAAPCFDLDTRFHSTALRLTLRVLNSEWGPLKRSSTSSTPIGIAALRTDRNVPGAIYPGLHHSTRSGASAQHPPHTHS